MTDNATSKAAYESANITEHQRKVLAFVRNYGPVACYQIEEQLEMSHQTASAAICELRRYAGKIYACGSRLNPATGRRWNTYQVVENLFDAKFADPKCGDNGTSLSEKNFIARVNSLTEERFRELLKMTKFRGLV